MAQQADSQALHYVMLVMGPAYGTQSASCAYQFAQSLLQTPHQLDTIFFYGDGVYNANQFTDPANDEFDLVRAWQALATQYNIKLAVCIAAAQRRGVIQADHDDNFAMHFQLTGLGELSEALSKCDRVIQF